MKRFRTKSGSIYDVDGKRIRQTLGKPTDRLSKEWRDFESILLRLGEGALIIWPAGTPLLPDSPQYSVPASWTSDVVEIWDYAGE